MNAKRIKNEMAVFFRSNGGYHCGHGLYDFRLHHIEKSGLAAEKWCEKENIDLRDRMIAPK